MCLIVFAIDPPGPYKLVLGANRDEYFTRPSAAAEFWDDAPAILAGRDLEAGGTWLGVNRNGKVAAVTNFRDPRRQLSQPQSRGKLVADYLRGDYSATDLHTSLHETGSRYKGFNLILGDLEALHYFSNHGPVSNRIPPGIHGLSNHLLDEPWPKVDKAKRELAALLATGHSRADDFFTALNDSGLYPDYMLPDTGIGLERERELCPIFITGETYGTRSTTLVLVDRDDTITFLERSFDCSSNETQTLEFSFHVDREFQQQTPDR